MTGDRQALSTARFRRVGQLATADTCLYLLQVILCKKNFLKLDNSWSR